jgi:hypothetical protein
MNYNELLLSKRQADTQTGIPPVWTPDFLYDFQTELTDWAIRQGRAAIFADCGLGKTPMQLVWAENIRRATGRPVLILTPLAVGAQTQHEADKFGIDVEVSRDGTVHPITVTNYERLHYFNSSDFAGVVCDESSAIKAFSGKRRAEVTEFVRTLQYRLLCTATAAPNDYIELGTSSEALGYLGYMDMLNRFFITDNRTSAQRGWGKQSQWRFKGHAATPFWRWVSSWARALRSPSDLGYTDDKFQLPPLHTNQHVIEATTPDPDTLFDLPAFGMREERAEQRRTIKDRCEAAAALLADVDTGIAWCQLNDEGDLLTELIPGAVQIKGSDSVDKKEETLTAFSEGQIRVLVTKPLIGAWGLNWQHCNRMTFFPTHSYEQYYQAVRRCWRFGQTRPVTVDLVTTEGGLNALTSIQRKTEQADHMFTELVEHMRDSMSIKRTVEYDTEVQIPSWLS